MGRESVMEAETVGWGRERVVWGKREWDGLKESGMGERDCEGGRKERV